MAGDSGTSDPRPKVLVLAGPLVPAEIARMLGARYDVAVAPAAEAASSLAGGEYQVVVAGVEAVRAGESGLPGEDVAGLLEAIGEGVCLASADGAILWANRRFRSLDEQTRARVASVCRLAGQRFADPHGPAGQQAAMRCDIASADQSQHYEVIVSPVQRGGGMGERGAGDGSWEGPRVAAAVWDVTASRRAQQKLEAVDAAGAELVRLDGESIRKMGVGERLGVLEEKIVRYSHDLLRFDHLAIRLLDERTGKLELVMSSGLPPEAMQIQLLARREGNGVSGYVAATGRSYLCGDVTKDPRYVTGLAGARSSLTVPLLLYDKVIGTFNVESEHLNAFTEEDRRFAEIFATHVALALHILDLLVVERCATGESVTGTVEGELAEPLNDILRVATTLRESAGVSDGKLREHLDRIVSDVEAIHQRVREAAEGPQHIIGAEKALKDLTIDPDLDGKTVLVADDEPRIRQTIREVLRRRGCTVIACENGGEAIRALEARVGRGRGRRVDLVISDIRMPDHNGYEVFAAARRSDAAVPVILMTGFGYDPHHSIVRASQEGLQCVLFKPFQAERLIEEVKKAVTAAK